MATHYTASFLKQKSVMTYKQWPFIYEKWMNLKIKRSKGHADAAFLLKIYYCKYSNISIFYIYNYLKNKIINKLIYKLNIKNYIHVNIWKTKFNK